MGENEQTANSIPEWFWQHLRRNALENGDKIAQIFADDGTTKTYEELYHDSVYVAEGLKEMGLKRGDVIAIVSRNVHELFPTVLGCVFQGVVVAPLSPILKTHEFTRNLSLLKPKVVITRTTNNSIVEKAIDEAGYDLDRKPRVYDLFDFHKEVISKGLKTEVEEFRPISADFETHNWLLAFSSGTTGPQKIIMVRDYRLCLDLFTEGSPTEKCDGPLMYVSQLFWATWWINISRSFRFNRTRIFIDSPDHENIVNAMDKYKPGIYVSDPKDVITIQRLIEQNPGKWDTSSLKFIFTLGSVMRPSLHQYLLDKYKTPIYQEYGSTEIGMPFRPDLEKPPVFGAIGKPLQKVKVVHIESREEITEPNQVGELLVKDAFVEYFNNPEATKNVYDENGWYKTGDIFYFKEDGNYCACGRVRDMFKFKGQWVIPNEIEGYIQQVPGVAEAVVVGKKVDHVFGSVPMAFVVRSPNSKVNEQDIKDFLQKEKVQDLHKLRGGVTFVESLPRNSNFKILRQKIQDLVNSE